MEQVARIKNLMDSDPAHYPSMSAFVTEAVDNQLSNAEAHRMLLDVLHELGGEPTSEDRQWVQQAIHAAELAAQNQLSHEQRAA
jgi:hypothetical protein